MANTGEGSGGKPQGQGAAGVGDQDKDAVSSAAGSIDQGRKAAAGGLKSAADYIGDHVGDLPGAATVQKTAAAATDSMETTAGYLRDTDMNQMKADVEDLVKRNPVPSILIAAAIGYLLGRSMSR